MLLAGVFGLKPANPPTGDTSSGPTPADQSPEHKNQPPESEGNRRHEHSGWWRRQGPYGMPPRGGNYPPHWGPPPQGNNNPTEDGVQYNPGMYGPPGQGQDMRFPDRRHGPPPFWHPGMSMPPGENVPAGGQNPKEMTSTDQKGQPETSTPPDQGQNINYSDRRHGPPPFWHPGTRMHPGEHMPGGGPEGRGVDFVPQTDKDNGNPNSTKLPEQDQSKPEAWKTYGPDQPSEENVPREGFARGRRHGYRYFGHPDPRMIPGEAGAHGGSAPDPREFRPYYGGYPGYYGGYPGYYGGYPGFYGHRCPFSTGRYGPENSRLFREFDFY